ncbi:MAG: tRNA (guanosine(46)-N7)-methyltransferase TrmB [Bdellovibrionia bacterium]
MSLNLKYPIDHPEYQYPRGKNPYWAKIQEQKGWVFCDHDTEEHAGNWRAFFPDTQNTATAVKDHADSSHHPRELHVEIGCNAGHVTLEWAKANPNAAYIGIDWKFKPIFRAAEKTKKRGIQNLLWFRSHAERLPFMFQPEEIDRLYLFFPDPWPKKAHWKNRFITAEQLNRIAPVVKKGGIFHIKTDHAAYFDWMLEAIEGAQSHWQIQELTRNLHQGHPSPERLEIPEVTLFEKLFIRDQIPIHSVKLIRKASSAN